jgi:DnaJ like chaperone protein
MWGKVLGAVIGAATGMVLAWSPELAGALALAGFGLGHFVIDREVALTKADQPPSSDDLLDRAAERSKGRKLVRPVIKRAAPEDQLLADLLCPLFIEVARVDGPVVQSEIRAIREYFQFSLKFDEAGLEAVRVALKSALATTPVDVETLVKRARTDVKPAQRLELVRGLYDLGTIDGELTRSEIDTLKRVVGQFNLSDEQLQQITKQFFGSGEAHFRTLGLGNDATDDDIRSAFRRLAAENHPDRVASLGPKQAEAAGERFRHVKEAYEALRKLRGF